LFDDDQAFVFDDPGFHLLLLAGLQGAFILSLFAHALNGIHDVTLLRQKGVAQINCPPDVVSQTLYHFGQSGQSLDARIPRFFRHRIGELFVLQRFILLQPPLEQDDFQRIGGCCQDLSQQRVRIESDWRY
jgi:hypothetical protein